MVLTFNCIHLLAERKVQQFVGTKNSHFMSILPILNTLRIMAFVPPAVGIDLIEDPLATMLEFAGFTEPQVAKIRADGFN